MALSFYYGTMGSGKTTLLLKENQSLKNQGLKTIILQPSFHTRDGIGVVKSRNGEQEFATIVPLEMCIFNIKNIKYADVIIVDEANFLSAKQVDELKLLSAKKQVLCYGVKIDFTGHTFEGSKRLLELSENLIEIESFCECGRKNEINAKIIDGKIIASGKNQVGGLDLYKPMCYYCFLKQLEKQKIEEKNDLFCKTRGSSKQH